MYKLHLLKEKENYKKSNNSSHLTENYTYEELVKFVNECELLKYDEDILKEYKEFMECREEEEDYCINTPAKHSNDKIMRAILKDRLQAAIWLNKWLEIEKEYEIKEAEIEEVTESYITKDLEDRVTDIVYKDKIYDGVFYLIEHQTVINYEMVKRISEYKNEIRNHYQKNAKLKNGKNFKIAKVIAIVLYTGDKEWNAFFSIKDLEVPYPRKEINGMNEYKLISSKSYTNDELEKVAKENDKNILAQIFLIDNIGQMKDINLIEKEVNKLKIKKENIQYISAYINNVIKQKYTENVSKLMINVLVKKLNEQSKEDGNMLLEDFVVTLISEGEKRGISKGISKGIAKGIAQGMTKGMTQVAINMLKNKCDKETIKKYTGLSDKKIEELEKSLQTA